MYASTQVLYVHIHAHTHVSNTYLFTYIRAQCPHLCTYAISTQQYHLALVRARMNSHTPVMCVRVRFKDGHHTRKFWHKSYGGLKETAKRVTVLFAELTARTLTAPCPPHAHRICRAVWEGCIGSWCPAWFSNSAGRWRRGWGESSDAVREGGQRGAMSVAMRFHRVQ